MAYANEGNVETYLTIDIDNSISGQITDWSTAVDEYIDSYCNRTFGNVGNQVRYFDGVGGKELDIDFFQTINTIEILEYNSDDVMFTLVEGRENDFFVYPYNEAKKHRVILTNSSTPGAWPSGKKQIKIDADWGLANVPKGIELAATMLLAGIIEKGLKGGSVRSESLGDYQVEFKELDDISSVMGVKEILGRFMIYEL